MRNRLLVLVPFCALCACVNLSKGNPMSTVAPIESTRASGAADFDFWIGKWRIANRRLVKRLAGSTEWETFEAIGEAHKLPGGIGNYDDFVAEAWRPGFVGMSFRVFNPVTNKWSIYWLDNQTGGVDPKTGQLNVPVVGGFENDVGIFTCNDTFDGKPIAVEYRWSNITPTSARWEQAFSPDGGKTWETNWVMEMTRVSR